MREIVHGNGGIVCRRDGDTFLVYCPSLNDYQTILENAVVGLAGDEGSSDRVRLRMGVYQHADHSIDIERRFDCAQMAATDADYLNRVAESLPEGVELVDDQLYWTETEGERTLECALTIQPLDGAEYSVWSCHRLITDLSEEDAWN